MTDKEIFEQNGFSENIEDGDLLSKTFLGGRIIVHAALTWRGIHITYELVANSEGLALQGLLCKSVKNATESIEKIEQFIEKYATI